jgi:hypothetical protein
MHSDSPFKVHSNTPSKVHSNTPSKVHSDAPSKEHSNTPSKVHLDAPSKVHSDIPSKVHSDIPSKAHSDSPSKVHSDIPSKAHSNNPSKIPSDTPSKVHSDTPSKVHSNSPSEKTCNESDVIITELASPFDALNGRYIELYFRDCKGQKLPGNVTLISWKDEGGYRNLEDSLSRALQLGRTVVEQNITAKTDVPKKGILTACRSEGTEALYGKGSCDAIGGSDSASDVDGTDTVLVRTRDGIRDIYGIPGRRRSGRNRRLEGIDLTKQDFTGGRALRRITSENNFDILNPSGDSWVFEEWEIRQNQSYRTMDPKAWEPVPEIDLVITEIVDPMLNSPVPRFVEVYAPNPDNRDKDLEGDLKLVIFQGSSKIPDWDSAVPLDRVPQSGFFVICNRQADIFWTNSCTTIIDSTTGVVNSNGNDQIAVINGNETEYIIVDIFGKIGSSGSSEYFLSFDISCDISCFQLE